MKERLNLNHNLKKKLIQQQSRCLFSFFNHTFYFRLFIWHWVCVSIECWAFWFLQ